MDFSNDTIERHPIITSEVVRQVKTSKKAAGLKVRLLEERDVPTVRSIMRQHHETTVFRNQPFSDWKLDQHFKKILARPPRMACMVAEWENRPVGVAWASADAYMLSDGPLFVTVHVIAVDLEQHPIRRAKSFLALVAGIRSWAASLNATHSTIHVTTGSNLKATDRLMRASGAQYIGGAYVV
ncbi:GNAT family N-acetyltransferase [Roseibium aggregatum]|uniref:N-acetyltransferase domain-containing protein n=1 Tax=Roseibium aggregatum TaxID=187304 RepID=A0A0M6YFH3_9HYPH|nr:hypothetical protein [Roseibium aggregatum]CTQ47570.1 hypothetical protein LAL4801_06032 [Roseibium aggregatum]